MSKPSSSFPSNPRCGYCIYSESALYILIYAHIIIYIYTHKYDTCIFGRTKWKHLRFKGHIYPPNILNIFHPWSDWGISVERHGQQRQNRWYPNSGPTEPFLGLRISSIKPQHLGVGGHLVLERRYEERNV